MCNEDTRLFLVMIYPQVVFLKGYLCQRHKIPNDDFLSPLQISENLCGYKFLKSQFFSAQNSVEKYF